MDIGKLIHSADFDFDSAALGRLRCGPIGDELSKFDKMARNEVSGEPLARSLAESIVRKLTGDQDIDAVAGGPPLSQEDLTLLSKADLDNFCNLFIARRLRQGITPSTNEKKGERKPEPVEVGCDGLASAIITHTDSQRAQMERILGQARQSIEATSLFDTVSKHTIGDSAADLARKYGIGETAAELARKYGVGDAAADLAKKYGVGDTAADLAKKYGIGESAADLARKYGIGESAADLARKYGVGESAVDLALKHGIGDSAADLARKYGIGEAASEQVRKDILGNSALEAAFRTIHASDNLGASIAALRASSASIADNGEQIPVAMNYSIPPNPLIETNKLLKKQQSYAEEMRPVFIRSAELIQTLTDTTLATQALANDNSAQAERHAKQSLEAAKNSMDVAKRSMWVAIISIAISIIVSAISIGISIHYGNTSPTAEQADKIAKDLALQVGSLDVAAKEDRAAFERNAREDRAAFTAAFVVQNAHVEELDAKIKKIAKPTQAQSK